ncbi:hypothetical protein EDF46_0065 [Frondihabitans sp. PhB188]|nr:hypothetical protein EDF46_0065 [Frondihabitans sp. PhB188]
MRGLAVVSIVVATIGWGPVQLGVFALAMLGVIVPRALGVRSALDLATGIACLTAAWSNVFELYTTVIGWDKLIHFALTGCLTALALVIAQRSRLLPGVGDHRIGFAVVATIAGLGLGAVWEMLEWAGHSFISPGIFVGYVDTIGDLAADGLGGLFAGVFASALLARPTSTAG